MSDRQKEQKREINREINKFLAEKVVNRTEGVRRREEEGRRGGGCGAQMG